LNFYFYRKLTKTRRRRRKEKINQIKMHLPYMLFIIIGIVGIAYCYPAVDDDDMIGILLFFYLFS